MFRILVVARDPSQLPQRNVSSTIFCPPWMLGLICRLFPVEGLSMIDLATLAVFSGAVLLLLLFPGPNMAFVISHGVTHGWRRC